jgi:two-component system alkaline phosphatase synthesis response regulator PhoP
MTTIEPQENDRCRALVVEDDPAIRRLVQKLLGRHGIEIDTAADGLAAIERLRGMSYAVILLDLMLPAASGYEVIEFIKRSGISTPVVVVSAVSQQELAKLDRDVVKLVISKPFDVEEFASAVAGFCRNEQRTVKAQPDER